MKAGLPILFLQAMTVCLTANLFPQQSSLQEPLELISAESLKSHVEFLGSDALQGRGTGSKGGKMAADYIASQLEQWNISPAGDNGTYFQAVPMYGSRPLSASQLRLLSNGKSSSLQLGKDYLLYKTGAQTFIPGPVSLVFVGYGISAPEYDYNDYQDLDVEGKVVVFMSGEPTSDDPFYFDGPEQTIYYYPESKQRIAISRGALGSIMIPTPAELEHKSWNQRVNTFAFEHVTLAYSVTSNLSIVMNPSAAERLFEKSRFNLEDVLRMHRENTIKSFPLEARISFSGAFNEREFLDSNVIGIIEGRQHEKDDSYVLLSAHYDHLGIGPAVEGDSIYNGVFDNAVGVAALLEIARVFHLLKEKPPRSVVFLFTTGEEKGLLGSTYYVDHPPVPLYKTVANINIDGLAMFDTFNDVIGVGAELSTLGHELEVVVSKLGLRVSPMPQQFSPSQSFARSDQIAFAKAGIPAILVAEGLDYQNMTTDEALRKLVNWFEHIYETPFDDLNQPMNFAAGRQHCQVIFSLVFHLANDASPAKWNPGTEYMVTRLRTIAEKR